MNHCIVWHGHHQAKSPIEILYGSFEDRLHMIETVKLQEENPQKVAWRKKLFKLVKGPLPEAIQQADAACWQADAAQEQADAAWQQTYATQEQAYAAFQQASAAFQQASATYWQADAAREQADAAWKQAIINHLPEIMALHAVECGCPWTSENNNIFNYMPEEIA
jgi:hypothetical protein